MTAAPEVDTAWYPHRYPDVAALGMDSYNVGRQTGKLVDRVLKGEKPGAIAPEAANKLSLSVNPEAARKQGVPLSDALIKQAAEVVK